MNTTPHRIHLNGPLDYLIFTQAPVNLSVNGDPTLELIGRITEHGDEGIAVRLSDLDGFSETELMSAGVAGTLSASYRSMRLEVNVELTSVDWQVGVVVLSASGQGQLIDNRGWQRAKFVSGAAMPQATVTIDTITGERSFVAVELLEFSYQTVSLYLDRTNGLALPNDCVRAMTIHRGRSVLFEATGRVARIDKRRRAPGHQDSYFVVIELDDPNRRPAIDIEPNKRRSDRLMLVERKDAFIEFDHPFLDTTILAYIMDLSNSGLSILIDDPKHALPAGMVIGGASLQLPLRPRFEVGLRVRGHHTVGAPGEHSCKISMAFTDVSPHLVKEVSAFVQRSASEKLVDANSEDSQSLWEFYFETGFIYGKKRRQLQGYSDAVQSTLNRLLDSNTPLLKKILYKEEGAIKGHVTAVKAFDHTLMVQHLNALKAAEGSAAMSVIRGMTSFFLDQSVNSQANNLFVCAYYRPDNLYPSLVFGETARLIDNQTMCWTQDYEFCILTHDRAAGTPAASRQGIVCRESTSDDWEALETLLIEGRQVGLLRMEGLSREQLTRLAISPEFEKIGLYRYRKVFVAQDEVHGHTAYAVCNYASPGLNFSELTNSIKFFYDGADQTVMKELADALVTRIVESYQATAMSEPVLLLAHGQPVPAGFTVEKTYTLWGLDLAHVKKFRDATEHIFRNLKSFVRQRKAS